MKTFKFFAAALAALTFVACGPDEEKERDLKLDPTAITIAAGETATITASVEATWTSSDATVATVAGDGKTAVVTGVKEGNAIVTASTKGGQVKTCVVKVGAKGGNEKSDALKGTQQWPIILDGDAYAANEKTIVASFQPNDVDQFLYVWDDTYAGGDGEGLNSLGNSGYTSLVVTSVGWSGCGYFLTEAGEGWKAAEELRKAIVANPDQYALHLAIKSADNAAHTFYFITNATKFVLGAAAFDGGTVIGDFARDGAWHEFDLEMANYAEVLANTEVKAGVNLFVALSGGKQGVVLNLDAVYFYKK